MEPSTVTGVRIIPIYNDTCLFHLRDDKPDIVHPNKWSFISGGLDEGETFEEAARRECEEEIGITPSNLHYLGRSTVSACFYTYLSDVEVQSLVLGEGQEIRFFDPGDMQGVTMTPKLEELTTIHLESLKRLMRHEDVSAEEFGLVK